MINLLPPQQKEALRTEENLKLILIFGIVAFFFLVSLVLILFLIKTTVLSRLKTQNIYLVQRQQELETPRNRELADKIERYNLIFSKLTTFYQKQLYLTEILDKVAQILPEGAYLTNLNFVRAAIKDEPYAGQISISGFSPSREDLLKFKENLEKEEKFAKVYFPTANWMTPENINFSASFNLKK